MPCGIRALANVLAGPDLAHARCQFQVLGPIEVVENGSRLSLGGKLAHKLLATLLIHACRVRTADQLIDDLWADRCPPTARASLHNLISRLRRSIGPGLLANAERRVRPDSD